jgi:hypothetical protein
MTMKRVFAFAFLATIFAASAAVAQQADPSALRISIVAGLNRATMVNSFSNEGVRSRTGLVAGLGLAKPLTSNLAFAPEIVWSAKGERWNSESVVTTTTAVDYLEIPLLLRLGLPTSGAARPYFLFGPSVAFKLRCNIDGIALRLSPLDSEYFGIITSVPCGSSETWDVKSFDAGGVVGAGMSYTHGTNAIGLSIRYNAGLTNMMTNSVKNRALQVLASFEFPLSGW